VVKEDTCWKSSFCINGLDQTNKSKKASPTYSHKSKVIGLITTILYTKRKQRFIRSFLICHNTRIQTYHCTSQSSSEETFSSDVMNMVELKEAYLRRQNCDEVHNNNNLQIDQPYAQDTRRS